MTYRTRTYYTDARRHGCGCAGRKGWTLHQSGHLIDRPHTSARRILSKIGGIRPPERQRGANALTLADSVRAQPVAWMHWSPLWASKIQFSGSLECCGYLPRALATDDPSGAQAMSLDHPYPSSRNRLGA